MNAPWRQGATPSVVLIEDDDTLALILSYNLEAEGCRVTRLSDGGEALERLREIGPDLVVLDWALPNLSGIEILRRLRRDTATRALPVVMLTARTGTADRRRAIDSGANLFVSKPFGMQELMAGIRGLLGVMP